MFACCNVRDGIEKGDVDTGKKILLQFQMSLCVFVLVFFSK